MARFKMVLQRSKFLRPRPKALIFPFGGVSEQPPLPSPDPLRRLSGFWPEPATWHERPLATVLYLSLAMDKPLFLEGEPGVGKTELALVLARSLGRGTDPPPMLRGAGRGLGPV